MASFVRQVLKALGLAAVVILAIRAALFGVFAPFLFWRLFRESGYPWWIHVPAAVALITGFTYLFRHMNRDRLW
jgi:hypothetical protein